MDSIITIYDLHGFDTTIHSIITVYSNDTESNFDLQKYQKEKLDQTIK
jgi:hypothetical protein